MSTVGLNETMIKKYIQQQEKHDITIHKNYRSAYETYAQLRLNRFQNRLPACRSFTLGDYPHLQLAQ